MRPGLGDSPLGVLARLGAQVDADAGDAEALRGADQEARVAAAEVDDVREVDAGEHVDRVGRDVVAADQRGAFGDPAAGALDVASRICASPVMKSPRPPSTWP